MAKEKKKNKIDLQELVLLVVKYVMSKDETEKKELNRQIKEFTDG